MKTERLILRPWTEEDAASLYKYTKTRPHTDEIRRNNANSWK